MFIPEVYYSSMSYILHEHNYKLYQGDIPGDISYILYITNYYLIKTNSS